MLVMRDPFARREVHRARVYTIRHDQTCDWCGGTRFTYILGRRYLFEYRVESDCGLLTIIKGLFCSNDCWRTYYQ